MFYTDKKWIFDQSERAQGPIYIIKRGNVKTNYTIQFII